MSLAVRLVFVVAFGSFHLSSGLRATVREHKPANTSYFWSSGRGSMGSYGQSPYSAPFDIKHPTWTWTNGERWSTIPLGTSIDDQKAIYVTCAEGIRKFSPDGKLIWTWNRDLTKREVLTKAAALMDGAAFGITTSGRVYALSMDTGRELWSTKVADSSDGNYGHVQANDGVVITAADVGPLNRVVPDCCGPANHKVVGVNGTDGKLLWTYEPTVPVWNFGSAFAGDGTFVFQDLEGRVHRNRVSDGTLVWKAGGIPLSWTDGQCNLGSNGIVYGVANYGYMGPKGVVTAYQLSDGTKKWERDVMTSPNSIPAVGHLYGHKGLSVVMPIGFNDKKGEQIRVLALNADTGSVQWIFRGFKQFYDMGKGDANPKAQTIRRAHYIQDKTLPNSWGTPAIDGAGTAYVGGITGHFVALRDVNGDGNVDGPDEVSMHTTDADFAGSSGPALAPGVLAVSNANSLMVWRWDPQAL